MRNYSKYTETILSYARHCIDKAEVFNHITSSQATELRKSLDTILCEEDANKAFEMIQSETEFRLPEFVVEAIEKTYPVCQGHYRSFSCVNCGECQGHYSDVELQDELCLQKG